MATGSAADTPERKRAIGARIKQARLEAGGMAQRELAELIGVTEASVQAYEQGRTIPHRFMSQIADATGVTPAWLYHGDEAVFVRDQQIAEITSALTAIGSKLDRVLDLLSSS